MGIGRHVVMGKMDQTLHWKGRELVIGRADLFPKITCFQHMWTGWGGGLERWGGGIHLESQCSGGWLGRIKYWNYSWTHSKKAVTCEPQPRCSAEACHCCLFSLSSTGQSLGTHSVLLTFLLSSTPLPCRCWAHWPNSNGVAFSLSFCPNSDSCWDFKFVCLGFFTLNSNKTVLRLQKEKEIQQHTQENKSNKTTKTWPCVPERRDLG